MGKKGKDRKAKRSLALEDLSPVRGRVLQDCRGASGLRVTLDMLCSQAADDGWKTSTADIAMETDDEEKDAAAAPDVMGADEARMDEERAALGNLFSLLEGASRGRRRACVWTRLKPARRSREPAALTASPQGRTGWIRRRY